MLPFVFLAAGLALSCLAWRFMQWDAEARAEQRFRHLEERLISSVQQRFTELSILMVHARTLVSLNEPTPAQWRQFYEGVAVHSPRGLVGVGYVRRVPRDRLSDYERQLRQLYGKSFYVESGGEGDYAYLVSLIEPQRENFAALGKDLTTGTTRRGAAESAMYSGELVTSRRINIVWREKTLPGFLAFMPIYEQGLPVVDPDQRRAALRGWVYASIQAEQLFDGLQDISEGQLDYEFFEGEQQSQATLLYDSDRHLALRENEPVGASKYGARSFVSRNELSLLGRSWHLAVSSRPEFDRANFDPIPVLVLAGGILFSALGASLLWSLLNSRDRARAEALATTQDLRDSELRIRNLARIASSTEQGVVLGDIDGVSWVNEGFVRMTGYSLAEVAGRKLTELLVGKGTDRALVARIRQALSERRGFTGQVLAYRKDGSELWMHLEMQTLADEERPARTSHMTMISDITERVHTEQQLRLAKEEADAANRAKSAFLAVMSHEIRTPLNGVIGMTSVLGDTALDEEQREFVNIIQTSGNTLLHLINDILDFSKIESGRLELEMLPFSPRAIVGEVVDLLAPRIAEKHIDLLFEVDPEVPMVVRSDPTRLKQILMNLAGNAVKFTEHGEVELRLGSAPPENGQVMLHFSIRDTGVGISPEAQSRLFQSFSQADASTTRRYGGTGLGLAISRRLAEQMGGHMGVESVVGEGATFFFSLRAGWLGRMSEPPSEAIPVLSGRRLLLVDDNATYRRILASDAARWGAQLRGASGAVEALQWLEAREPFDVVLVDQHMPDMGGLLFARELRRLPEAANLPLVLLAPAPQTLSADDKALFDLVAPKPGHPGQLGHLLARLFGYVCAEEETSSSDTAPAPSTTPVVLHTEKVLLVEDDPVNQRVAVLLLRRLGYSVELAGDGTTALERCRSGNFDIILLDLQMPGVSGLEVSATLRRLNEGQSRSRPWIIAMTANVMPDDRHRCRQAGMDDFLPKPICDDELLAAMERGREAVGQRGTGAGKRG